MTANEEAAGRDVSTAEELLNECQRLGHAPCLSVDCRAPHDCQLLPKEALSDMARLIAKAAEECSASD